MEPAWSSLSVHKPNFILWMRAHMGLPTRVRLHTQRLGNVQDLRCVLCSVTNEACYNLFYECNLAAEIWERICRGIGIQGGHEWNGVTSWYSTRNSSSMNFKQIARASAVPVVCSAWQGRNPILFQGKQKQLHDIVKEIQLTVGSAHTRTVGVRRIQSGSPFSESCSLVFCSYSCGTSGAKVVIWEQLCSAVCI